MSKLHKDIARACPLVYTFGRMEDPVQRVEKEGKSQSLVCGWLTWHMGTS